MLSVDAPVRSDLNVRPGKLVRFTIVACFAVATVIYIVLSLPWPLIWDMQVIHYVSFLMDRGWAPYRQIGDMNMPGAYLVEHFALHTFGASDLGWRFWDYSLCAVAVASMFSIARRYDWLAAVLAGGFFTLMHGADGPMSAGQRDEVMAVLLIASTALLFEAVRRQQSPLAGLFGFAAAMAAAIKPTVGLFFPLALALALGHLGQERKSYRSYLVWALGGATVAAAIVLGYLLKWQAFGAFIHLLGQVIPHYAGTNQMPWLRMLWITLLPPLYFYVGLALLVALPGWRKQWNWEQAVLLAGALVGLVNFYAQRKGFPQHRYTLTTFLLLWASLQLVAAMGGTGPRRHAAVAAVAITMVVYIPRNLDWMRFHPSRNNFSFYLANDLRSLGTEQLQGKVQCLDVVDGCLNALFHLRVVQSTGSTGDLLLFLPQDSPTVEEARANFQATVERNPPDVYVLGNWQFGVLRHTFDKVDTWPAFRDKLSSQYILAIQREFPPGKAPTSSPGTNPDLAGYRIYIRRGSPLLDKVVYPVSAEAVNH